MAKLLYIQTSPRGQRSKSNTIADAFVAEYANKNPHDKIEKLNLFEFDMPSFDGATIEAKYVILHGKNDYTGEQKQAWSRVEEIIDDFKSADKYVLATPMWNFSIPYRLKQYIDIVVQPGYTFGFAETGDYKGLVRGRKMVAVYARGGEYKGAGTKFDFQSPYVKAIFNLIGIMDIQELIVEPTLQGSPEQVQQIQEQAIEKAKELALQF